MITTRPILQTPVAQLALLVSFIAGGIVAPAAHRLCHGVEFREIVRDLSSFEGHAHGDDEILSYPLPLTDYREPYCVLCTVVFDGLLKSGDTFVCHDDEPRRVAASSSDHAEQGLPFLRRAPPAVHLT